jgi:LPPG:FO 2-phospho-L-lactate transferase
MKITALAGGVGAARLLAGLAELLAPGDLTIIVNTGDDFRYLGLYVCPDLDTVIYTLAGVADPTTGWGIRGDTCGCHERLALLQSETWFRLGDRDLATQIFRTHFLGRGGSLTDVTRILSRKNGIQPVVLPMTDSEVPTLVHTDEGTLDFQDYFVRKRCAPQVRGFQYRGSVAACPAPGVLDALLNADAVVLCPSNPYISIGPILAVPGIRESLRATHAAVLAVSPIVGGKALKGPAAAMMRQLGEEASAATVARLYLDFLDIFVLDRRDQSLIEPIRALGPEVRAVETIMDSPSARLSLAASLLRMLA